MKISFSTPTLPKSGTVIVFSLDEASLLPSAQTLDETLGGALSRAAKAKSFKGGKGESLRLVSPGDGSLTEVILMGLGKADAITDLVMQDVGGKAYAAVSGLAAAAVVLDAIEGCDLSAAAVAANVGYGAQLASYRFDKYRTKEPVDKKPKIKTFKIGTASAAGARTAYAKLEKIADGIFFTRDLVSEPPNVLYPESFAKEVQTLKKLGVTVDVLGEKEMKKLGMGALLGVGQGSIRESKIAVMQWAGAEKAAPKGKKPKDLKNPIAFVGKGVCFDTGGISLKPAGGMEDMKWDMGGAGVVSGLMKALAGRKAKVNAVGVIGLVENMPDGNAQRPGDIVTTMSGQTIEVLNTDAEGRLVLADAMWYTQERFKPKFVIDLATLTGAIIVSLGNERAGLFANDDTLADQLMKAGDATGDLLWRMPLGDAYDEMIKSDAADMQNIGGRWGGSITAAQLLQRFIQDDTPWAHLDIAGVAWSKKSKPTVPKGGTGWGVKLLDRLVADHYEG